VTVGMFLTVGPTVLFPRLTRHRHESRDVTSWSRSYPVL